MASNPFDQFDAPSAPNTFDQFDEGKQPKPAGFVRKAADLGVSAVKSAIGVPELAVGLADLATGGRAGKALQEGVDVGGVNIGFRPKEARDALDELYSDDFKGKRQAFQDADGVVDKTIQAVTNPSLIANAAVESLGSMGAGGLAARGLMRVIPRLSAVGAAAAGEGVAGAGSAAEQIRQETDDGLLTGQQSALAGASGLATSLLGAAGGAAARKLGIADVDTAIARGTLDVPETAAEAAARIAAKKPPKGMARRAGEGAVAEGLLEELPQSLSEQGLQNVALDRDVTEGMVDAGVMGALTGGAMGAGAGALSRSTAAESASNPGEKPEAPPDVEPAPDPASRPYQFSAKPPGGHRGVGTAMGTPKTETAPATPEAEGVDAAAGPLSAGVAQAVSTGAVTETRAQQEQAQQDEAAKGEQQVDYTADDREAEPHFETLAQAMNAVVDIPGAAPLSVLPLKVGDGYMLVRQDDEEFDTAWRHRFERLTEAGVQPGDIMSRSGEPFTAAQPNLLAQVARANPGYEAVQIQGGYVVRRTQAPQADQAPAAAPGQAPAAAPGPQARRADAVASVAPARDAAADGQQALTLPRVAIKGLAADEVNMTRDLADRTGLTQAVHDLSADGLVAAQISQRLAPELFSAIDRTAELNGENVLTARREAIRRVRMSLGIPSADEADFKDWQAGALAARAPAGQNDALPGDRAAQGAKVSNPPPQGPGSQATDTTQGAIAPTTAGPAQAGARGTGEKPALGKRETPSDTTAAPGVQAPAPVAPTVDSTGGPGQNTPAAGGSLPIVEHVTGKGKTLRGVVRTDLDLRQAKEIDTGSFKKDGGFFIRERAFDKLADFDANRGAAANVPAAAPAPAPGGTPAAAPAPANVPAAPAPAPAPGKVSQATEKLVADGKQTMETADRWMRSTTVERQAILARAGLSPNLASRPFTDIERPGQQRIQRAIDYATQPAEPAAAPGVDSTPNDKGERAIGRRADGTMVREDKRGVRFITEGGVRIEEKVTLRPTREGLKIARGELEPRFMTAEESAAVPTTDQPPSGKTAQQRWNDMSSKDRASVLDRAGQAGRFSPSAPWSEIARSSVEAKVADAMQTAMPAELAPDRKPAPTKPTKAQIDAAIDAGVPFIGQIKDGATLESLTRQAQANRDREDAAREATRSTPAPAEPKARKPSATLAGAAAARERYFTPGNIVESYAGHDRIISYTPNGADADGRWSVQVQAVQKKGDEWVDVKGERPRYHSTPPSTGDLRKGPVSAAPAAADRRETPPSAAKVDATANTVFTQDAYEAARARMKRKLGTLNSGIDPELLQDGITVAGYHLERGARKFAAWSQAMLSDLGEEIRPYLKQLYMAVKFDPRASNIDGMDSAAAVESADVASIQAPASTETVASSIEAAAAEVDTDPTDAQKEAGNYRKGHVTVQGIDLAIENPLGSTRSGTGPNGPWSTTMTAHYGYAKRTEGGDGEQVDVYLAANPKADAPVFVVDQYDGATFDEHKAIMGVASPIEAARLYDAHFSDGSGPRRRRGITQMTAEQFKAWASSPAAQRPALENKAPAADTPTTPEATNDSSRPRNPAPLDQALADRQDATGQGRAAGQPGAGPGRSDDGGVRVRGGRAARPDDAGQDMGNRRGNAIVPDGSDAAVAANLPAVPTADYRVPAGGLTRTGSWQASAARNVDLIELALSIEKEGRPATPAEQAQLSKYVGFGASAIRNELFPVVNSYARQQEPDRLIWPNHVRSPQWRALAERLDKLPKAWQKSVLQSTQYAHYTSEGIIRNMWSAAERMGFTGGKMFEPGMGIGSFAMAMPDSLRADSSYTGVEFDGPTALIARLLSPAQNMLHADFIKRKFPRNFFDLAIGNPPFSQTKILGDPEYEKHGFVLHDFFFAKSIDRVRPGGLLMFVTGKGTMDKQGDKARRYLADRADLMGAIRLPSTAFEANAGTSVVTDVIFLRKRAEGEAPGGHPWRDIQTAETPDGTVPINEFYVQNPQMVLGQNRISGNLDDQGRRINSNGRGGENYTVVSYDTTPAELDAKFAQAIKFLPENVYSAMRAEPAVLKAQVAKVDFNPLVKREGVVYIDKGGDVMVVSEGVGKPLGDRIKLSEKDKAWFKGYAGIRDLVNETRGAQYNDGPWEKTLAKLNKAYDAFVKAHGPINAFRTQVRKGTDEEGNPTENHIRIFTNRRLLREDYDSAIVTQLETIDEGGNVVKAPFLLGRTIGKPVAREVRSIGDALAVSLDEGGALDVGDIARRLNISRDEAIEALGTQIYRDPSGEWMLADAYLSGDVVEKLEAATLAARLDPSLERNVEALRAVQPEKLGPSQISVKLGASWVPARYVNSFAEEVGAGAVRFDAKSESWQVEGGNQRSDRKAGAEYGTADRSASELLEAALNSRSVTVKKSTTGEDGKKKEVTDTEATTAAADVIRKMREKFKSWIWTDSERATDLVDSYNTRFNNLAPRRFDGSHLTLPGVSTRFKLHPHQLRAIWRQIQTGDTYLAHAVGAGKTIEMIAGGMEQKRLGLIDKPTYVVPNHMLEQFANEFMELYPLANVMVADDENFSADRRKAFVAAVTLNGPDAVVITQSAFERIGLKEESVAPIRDALLDDLQNELDDADKSDRVRRSQLQQQIEAVEQRFDSIIGAGKKDSTIHFEDMGIDFIYSDESHAYRKLDFTTNQKIKGIDPNGSRRALDMYVKTRVLQAKKPGRAMVFASGTPVTNTMGELYTIMRFFAPEMLERGGIKSFDAWARQFGESVSALEANAAGRYETVERFARFDNIPELMSRVRSFMDVLTSDQLGSLVQRPSVIGGKPNLRTVEATPQLKAYMKEVLMPRLEISRRWKPSPQQPFNPDPVIAITSDGRFAALDPRFFGADVGDQPTKMSDMASQVVANYKATANNVYLARDGSPEPIRGGTQIVFYNLGFGAQSQKNRGFNARGALTKMLTDGGVAKDHILWFDDADTDAKKERMFRQMRSGEARVLIGSAKKMGTGVNVQKRLAKLHYFDPPWFPSDVEQPHGRIIRQGNQNTEVEIDWYATKGTYDSTMWQMVARKQRFIDQAFTGDKSVRSMDDMSEASQYEQAAALASGDPRALQLAGYRQDVERLERLQASHSSEQIKMRQAVSSWKWQETTATKTEAEMGKVWQALGGKYVTYEAGAVGGRTFDKQTDFGAALKAEFNKVLQGNLLNVLDAPKVLGTINGHEIHAHQDQDRKGVPTGFYDVVISAGGSNIEVLEGVGTMGETVDNTGLARKMINALNSVEGQVTSAKRKKAEAEAEIRRLEKKMGAPFEYQQELAEKHAAQKTLEAELKAEGEADAAQANAQYNARAAQVTIDADGNTPAARLGEANPAAMNRVELDDTVRSLAADWRNAPEIIVARGLDDQRLAPTVRAYFQQLRADGAVGTPKGAFFGGQVYLFADAITSPRDAAETVFHEALGHYGLRGVFGASLGRNLDLVINSMPAEVAAKAAEYGYTMANLAQRRMAAEEVLAELAERSPTLPLVRRVVAAIRQWLRENVPLFSGMKLSDTDIIANFIIPAQAWVQQGRSGPASASSTGAPASQADDGAMFRLTKADYQAKALDYFNTIADAPGKLNWWHKTVGTQYNLAQRSAPYKRVFDSVQSFIGDVSRYATEAADMAPQILPKLDSIRDIGKRPISTADNAAIAKPIFEGTLAWTRVDGKPRLVEDMEKESTKLSLEDKAGKLLRANHVAPNVLRMWQGLPQDQYESIINSKFEQHYLQPGIVWTPAELRGQWGLTDAQAGLYQEFRAGVNRSLNDLATSDMVRWAGKDIAGIRSMVLDAGSAEAAGDLIREHLLAMADETEDPAAESRLRKNADEVLVKAGKVRDLTERGYAPLSRFGQYTLDVVDASGERQYFGMFESRFEAAAMARKMKVDFPDAAIRQGTVSEQEYKMFAGVSPETLELFGAEVGLEKSEVFQEYLKLAKSTRSAMKRLIRRKGTAGFSDEVGRVLAGFVYSNARQTSTNLHSGEMQEAAASDEFKGSGELRDAAIKLVQYVQNPQEEAQALRGLLFAQYIGGSIASAAVNLTQTVAMTFPYLSQYGGVVKAAGQMRRAIVDALKEKTGDAELDRELKAAEARGTVSPQEVHQLQAQASGRGALRSGDGTKVGNALATANNALSRIMLAWGKPFSAAEQFNRRATFIAAYRTALAEGIADPAAFADKAIAETQGVYNKGNKPAWARGAVGSTLFTFKQFGISYVELVHRMATSGPDGRRGAAVMLSMLFLLSGAGGLPFEEDLEDIIDGLMQRLGYSWNTKAQRQQFLIDTLGEPFAEFLDRGVSGIAGVPIDVSGRLGMGNLLPGTGLLTKKTDYGRDVAELAGVGGDFVKRAGQALGQVVDGSPAKAVMALAPTAVRNIVQAADMGTNDMYRDQRGRKVIDTDMGDAIAKGLGFQPTEVAKVQEATWLQQNLIAQVKMRETEIADQWAIGVFEKDPDKVQAARDALARWNENNPTARIMIKPTQIAKRVQAMNTDKATRIAKTAPKEIREAVRRELQVGQ